MEDLSPQFLQSPIAQPFIAHNETQTPNVVRKFAAETMDAIRAQSTLLSAIDNTGIIVITYLALAASIYAFNWLLSDTSEYLSIISVFYPTFLFAEKPEAFDRRQLFDAQTRIKELSIECQKLRHNAPAPTQLAQLEDQHRALQEKDQLIRRLREQAIDPALLDQKDETIARLQRASEIQAASAEEARKTLLIQHQEALERLKVQIAEKEAS